MDGDPAELERRYNFRRRIRDEQVIYGDCGALVATTPIQRGILADSTYGVPFGKVHVIPPGYDDSRFFPVSAATRAALRRQHGYSGRIVLALGRMARNKGYDLLVAAMPTVLQRVADARLLLALGAAEPTPDERAAIAELRSAAEALGIAEHVIFRDYIPDEALPDYYRLADVFALSSRYEPFGMTAVEAMACGTPTVVTTEGGLWEQVIWGLEALYANPFDPEAFGHALCTILQRPRVAAQLARHGSHRARASFAWMGIAQQVLAVLERLHARPGRARQPALEPVAAEEPAWRLPYSTSAT
jgi:mannosylfructose-phosphate synthase